MALRFIARSRITRHCRDGAAIVQWYTCSLDSRGFLSLYLRNERTGGTEATVFVYFAISWLGFTNQTRVSELVQSQSKSPLLKVNKD